MRRDRTDDLLLFDAHTQSKFSAKAIIGVDEAGRGSLAGPVVVAAVMLDPRRSPRGLDDSKKLPPELRVEIARKIRQDHRHCIVVVDKDKVELLNVLGATMYGMHKAVSSFAEDLSAGAIVVVDGNIKIPEIPEDRQAAVVKADAKSACVAAASILAKVSRDEIMDGLALHYPGYGFEDNKGYGSPTHIETIRSLGLSSVHRPSFCRKFLQNSPAPNDAFL